MSGVLAISVLVLSIIIALFLADSDALWVSKSSHKHGAPYYFTKSPYPKSKTLFPVYKLWEKDNKSINISFTDNKLYIGMPLYCKNGETVKLVEIKEKSIIVEYKGRNYSRSKSAIGDTLYLKRPF